MDIFLFSGFEKLLCCLKVFLSSFLNQGFLGKRISTRRRKGESTRDDKIMLWAIVLRKPINYWGKSFFSERTRYFLHSGISHLSSFLKKNSIASARNAWNKAAFVIIFAWNSKKIEDKGKYFHHALNHNKFLIYLMV